MGVFSSTVDGTVTIGGRGDGEQDLTAILDEVYIIGKALTSAEVLELNNSFYPFVGDTTPPLIFDCILTSPHIDGIWENYTNDVTPTGNCTITDAGTVSNARASNDTTDSYDDMTASRDMTSGSEDDWIWTIIGADQLVPDGNYSLCFTASDISGNNHSSCNATISCYIQYFCWLCIKRSQLLECGFLRRYCQFHAWCYLLSDSKTKD